MTYRRERGVHRRLHGKDCSDVHGRDCSYNPFAFPPSLEVRCTNAAGARIRRSGLQSFCISTISAIGPCIALTSDFLAGRLAVKRRRYESRDGRGRTKQDARVESNAWSTTIGI